MTEKQTAKKTEKLFVYGTLAPGRPNEHVLAPLAGAWQPGAVKGRLLPHGWGATLGYPALIPDDAGEEVRGLLFTADKLGAFWPALDEFEGEGYERVLIDVRLDDGSTEAAYVYVLRGGETIWP